MNARLLVLALVAITLIGCGCSTAPRGASTSASPRARCLVDPNEGGTRPLLYLLCIESP